MCLRKDICNGVYVEDFMKGLFFFAGAQEMPYFCYLQLIMILKIATE